MHPNIVILARHFPPQVSGGARRPFLLASGLSARGYNVRVIAPCAPENATFATTVVPHTGEARIAGMAEPENTEASALRNWLRNTILFPDPDIRWSLAAGRAVPRLSQGDWILTTSPPESLHVAGALAKRRYGCRWLADFRDSWIEYPYRENLQRRGLRRASEAFLAQRLLKCADAVSGTTSQIMQELHDRGARGPAKLIGHFSESPKTPKVLPDATVNVVHSGSFSLSDPKRSIAPVLRALETSSRENIRLYLVGRLTSKELVEIANSPAHTRIEVVGTRSREDALAYQAGADALLVAAAPGSPHVPGKLAEYLAAGKPVLAIGGGAWVRTTVLRHAENSEALAMLLDTLQKNSETERFSEHDFPNVLSEGEAITAFLNLMGCAPPG